MAASFLSRQTVILYVKVRVAYSVIAAKIPSLAPRISASYASALLGQGYSALNEGSAGIERCILLLSLPPFENYLNTPLYLSCVTALIGICGGPGQAGAHRVYRSSLVFPIDDFPWRPWDQGIVATSIHW